QRTEPVDARSTVILLTIDAHGDVERGIPRSNAEQVGVLIFKQRQKQLRELRRLLDDEPAVGDSAYYSVVRLQDGGRVHSAAGRRRLAEPAPFGLCSV